MTRGRLPSTALRTFEAAGRLASFTRAAEELFVSQAAVSRQVRDLETSLGRRLFERHHRRVALTDDGRRLLAQLTTAFDDIDRALRDLKGTPSRSVLIVSCDPSFAAAWLVPRLDDFHRRHPDVDVLVEADQRLVEVRSHGAEIDIRHSATETSWPRTRARHLIDARVTPLAAAGAYWLVMSDRRPPNEPARAFVAWIEAQFPPPRGR